MAQRVGRQTVESDRLGRAIEDSSLESPRPHGSTGFLTAEHQRLRWLPGDVDYERADEKPGEGDLASLVVLGSLGAT